MDIHISFIRIIIFFDEPFKYGDGAQFRDYIRTNAEQLSVYFCNFVQFNILVNYLNFCLSVGLCVTS
jgi:hypothetical protein